MWYAKDVEHKPAYFLILRVQTIVKTSDRQHDDTFSSHILKGFGDRDGPTLTDQIRIRIENCKKIMERMPQYVQKKIF